MTELPVLNYTDFIRADGEVLTTDSLKVAAVFGKRHDHVLRDIRALVAKLPTEFSGPNFGGVTYTDGKGEVRSMYTMTRDGFTLLAMRFSGKRALDFQVAYIQAFNAMERHLKNQREGLQYRCLAKELEFKNEKQKVSAHARGMRKWQDDKPLLQRELDTLLELAQPSLLAN